MGFKNNLLYIVLFLVFSCNIFAQYRPSTYEYSNVPTYSKPGTINVVKTQSTTTYNSPNFGFPYTNYGQSAYGKYSPHYSRYYPSREFNYGPYSLNRYGTASYMPYRGSPMVDPQNRAAVGLGLLASSLLGKKHA